MKYIAYVFWLLIIIVATTFSSLNSHSVELNYYLGTLSLSLSLLLLMALCLGLVLGVLMILPSLIRTKCGQRKLKMQVQQNELEIKNLRTFPLKDDH
jgi:putative membrane protein